MAEAHALGLDDPVDHRAAGLAGAPRQCHRFFAGVTTNEGVLSSWKGQRPMRSLPCFLKATPHASARRCTEISDFSRSTTSTGIRAIGSPKNLSRAFRHI